MKTTNTESQQHKARTNLAGQTRKARREATENARRAIAAGLPTALLTAAMAEEIRPRRYFLSADTVKNGKWITRATDHETGEQRTYVNKDCAQAQDTANLDFIAYGKKETTYIIAVRDNKASGGITITAVVTAAANKTRKDELKKSAAQACRNLQDLEA